MQIEAARCRPKTNALGFSKTCLGCHTTRVTLSLKAAGGAEVAGAGA